MLFILDITTETGNNALIRSNSSNYWSSSSGPARGLRCSPRQRRHWLRWKWIPVRWIRSVN